MWNFLNLVRRQPGMIIKYENKEEDLILMSEMMAFWLRVQ